MPRNQAEAKAQAKAQTSLQVLIAAKFATFTSSLLDNFIASKSNTEPLFARAYIADELERLAQSAGKRAWNDIDPLLPPTPAAPGEHMLSESPHFACTVKNSNPVRRFNLDEFARLLQAERKVPLHVTRELYEKAKLEGQPTHTFRIIER